MAADMFDALDGREPPTSSCSGVYLDFGCNIGVQTRKLFEPERYPGSPLLPLFAHVFGGPGTVQRQTTCTVCVEPNPEHTERLHRLERHYATANRTLVVMSRAIQVGRRATIEMAAPVGGPKLAWGFHAVPASSMAHTDAHTRLHQVQTVDPGWLLETWLPSVGWLTLDNLRRTPTMLKLDLEGGESAVLPYLVESQLLCRYVDVLFM